MPNMNEEVKQIIVGALSCLALLVIVMQLFNAKASQSVEDDGYNVIAVFGRIDGLDEDAVVRMGGVQVGQIVQSRLDADYSAIVTMRIKNGVNLPLDSSAAIHTEGLFGSKYIELEPGGEEEFMKEGDRIDFTQSSVVIEELLDLIISEGKARQAQQAEQ